MTFDGFLSDYGQVGFGAAVFIAIWKIVVAPFMKSQSDENKATRAELRATAELNRATSDANRATSQSLERVTERLEGIIRAKGDE